MVVVEKAFVISLQLRADRLARFVDAYPRPSWLPELDVWPAIHGDTCQPPDNWTAGNGAWGCMKSHANILEYCLNNRVQSYIVFEDDAVFADFFCDYSEKFINELPLGWQMAYLGGQLQHAQQHPPIRVSKNVYIPFNVNRTHCFMISRAGMLPVYRWISNLPYHSKEHIDHHLGRLHEGGQLRVYCPGQWSVGQGGSSSNISGNTDPVTFYDNPESLARDHWLYQRPVCVILRASPSVAKRLTEWLHFGYDLDGCGYDCGLTLASKFRYPGPQINIWYSHVCSEIVREWDARGPRLPCLFHPQITEEFIEQANIGRTIELTATTAEEAARKAQLILSTVLGSVNG